MNAKTTRRPGKRQYERAAMEMLLRHAPHVYACMKCGWPVREGFCCGTCGDSAPYEPREAKPSPRTQSTT